MRHRPGGAGWPWHHPRFRGGFFAYYVRASLHRRIFFLLGFAIVVTGIVAGGVSHLFGVDVHSRPRSFVLLAVVVIMLWGASGRLARRLTRPFVELARVAQEIGKGNLGARYVFRRHGWTGEAFLIGVSINEMAERIERQLRDQRELLAAVSHEVRTPLARIRMLVELARSRTADGAFVVDGKTLDDLDREVIEIDALVGELLASSRLDFAALSAREMEAGDVARRALERQSLSPPLTLPSDPVVFHADPTLMQRALANLLHNAVVHAGGVDAFVVIATPESVRFEVKDRGPGLAKGDEARVFESFYQGNPGDTASGATHSSLGLGLALVKRIAEAHGGRAFAEARSDAPGACMGIQVPRAAPTAD